MISLLILSDHPSFQCLHRPVITNNNWNTQTPLIEANHRYQVSGQKAICNEVIYLPTSIRVPKEIHSVFHVYPNPFTTDLQVINRSDRAAFLISVYQISGRLVYSEILSGIENTIDTDVLNPGMYIVHIEGEEHRIFKMVKH